VRFFLLTLLLHSYKEVTTEILRYPNGSPEVLFWQGKLQESARLLRENIEELRNHVTDTSKVDSFYVYFHWRAVDERAFYALELALVGIYCYGDPPSWDAEFKYLVELLHEELTKIRLKFKDTKFFKFFTKLGSIPYAEHFPGGLELIPIREYLGNYEIPIQKLLKRIYTVRYNTPRRVKKKEFHRGYDDKGSESSVSERARRSANTVEFPYLTKDFLEFLRIHKDPIGLLRRMGYLRGGE